MAEPGRIVSLVPSHTETLHGLGLADRVVGRTRFCVRPRPWVESLPAVGGTKDARLGRILGLRPDLVVADKDENPKALVEALQQAGVQVLWSDVATVDDAAAFVLRLAGACGGPAPERAEAWSRRLAGLPPPAGSPIPVFCPIWHPWMAFDGTAYASDVLARAGLRNVLSGHRGPRYFPVTEDEVRAAGAEWTLLPTEPFPFHRKVVDTAGLGAAGRPERVRIIDGEALTWFGWRTPDGVAQLARVAAGLAQAGTAPSAGQDLPRRAV